MEGIQINRTKYQGLSLSSLIFMVKTKAPVDDLLKREVWKELFYRYFSEGRSFNLYKVLDKEPLMFANTISWELTSEKVSIPEEHAEAFIRNLLAFIEYIDRTVLQTNNLEFEWQLHELQGLKSMLERVRDAQIVDMNLRQKINLFIDKINLLRKTSLQKIENDKRVKEDENYLPEVKKQALLLSEQKQALMKQELKHLSIPVSKMNKSKWIDAMQELDIYYPKEQEKLLRHGLKKFSDFYDIQRFSLRAFELNLRLKLPNVSMIYLLLNGLGFRKEMEMLFGTEKCLLEKVQEWYLSCVGATEQGWYDLSTVIISYFEGEDYKRTLTDRQLQKMRDFYPFVQKYKGGNLSKVLSESTGLTTRESYPSFKVVFSQEFEQWVATEDYEESTGISVFEQFYLIFGDVQGEIRFNSKYSHQVFNYEIQMKKYIRLHISELVPKEDIPMIHEFCNFPPSLVIDEETTSLLDVPVIKKMIPEGFWSDSRKYFLYFFKHKHMVNAISLTELEFLYKTEKGRKLFNSFAKLPASGSGQFREKIDFIADNFTEVINLFNFQEEAERKLFFELDFNASDFFTDYKSLTLEHAQLIVNKLEKEAPHEYSLISEYFYGINETYEEYQSFQDFEYLSSFERLLLERSGVSTGEIVKHHGYKESSFGRDIYYTPEQAVQKFVIEFMKNQYPTKREARGF